MAKKYFTAEDADVFLIEFGDFLDEFYRASKSERESMLNAAPDETGGLPPERQSFLAASCHKLANDHGLPVPEWVWNRKYYLDEPYFGSKARGSLRLYYMYMSPTEFKHRNLFVDENVLVRV